jgi:hypothetical protein
MSVRSTPSSLTNRLQRRQDGYNETYHPSLLRLNPPPIQTQCAWRSTRVSTKDKGQDYTNKLNQLREFAARHGLTIVVEFSDTVSGGTAERVQFQAMLQAASRREFEYCSSGVWIV